MYFIDRNSYYWPTTNNLIGLYQRVFVSNAIYRRKSSILQRYSFIHLDSRAKLFIGTSFILSLELKCEF